MSQQEASLEKMMAVWNTTDAEEKRALVEAALDINTDASKVRKPEKTKRKTK